MRQADYKLPELSALEATDLKRIREAVRLLILVFWGQGGRKDWVDLVCRSKETWESLNHISGLECPEILQTTDLMLRKYPLEELGTQLESEFVKIFINTRGGVSAPLYHSFYHDPDKMLMREPAVEMNRLLEQACLDLGSQVGEPPDHLCIELEYLFFLLSQPHVHNDQQLWEHIRLFSRDFMLPWLDMFQKKIPSHEPASFFAHSALAMNRLVRFLGC